MAEGPTPHYHNDMGVAVIETGAREFMCIGARPPFDHPHVFLDMGAGDDFVCPYCSTRFVHNDKLKPGEARPQEALWNAEAI